MYIRILNMQRCTSQFFLRGDVFPSWADSLNFYFVYLVFLLRMRQAYFVDL